MTSRALNGHPRVPVIVGTIIWAVAGIVMIAAHTTLASHGVTWWIGACAIAVFCGLMGLLYLNHRDKRESVRSRT